MASTRVLRMSSPLGLGSSRFSNSACSSMVSRSMAQMCLSKAGLRSKNMSTGGGDKEKTAVNAGGSSACVVISEPKTDKGLDLAGLIANTSNVILQWWIMITKQSPWKFDIQMFIEKVKQ